LALYFDFLKIQNGGGRHLENHKKCRYLCNGFTNFYEIWYDVVDKMKMIPVKDDTVTEN